MRAGRLAYITVVSTDVGRTALVLGAHLGLERREFRQGAGDRTAAVFTVGETAIAVASPGDPMVDGERRPGVHHIAFAADDPHRAAADAAERLGCRPGEGGDGLGGAQRVSLPAEATEGVRTYFTHALPGSPARLPSLVERVDHLGIVSSDTQRAIDVFHRRLGLPLESQQVDVETSLAVESFTSDRYGAVYHTRKPVFNGGVRSAFITTGDCELEFLEDYSPLGPGQVDSRHAGTTRQDRGAIARFLATRGQGLAHVALKTPDIAAALARAAAAGCDLIDAVGRPGGRRSQIAFIHPRSMGGVLFHFVQRD